jgi:hypothetical protein
MTQFGLAAMVRSFLAGALTLAAVPAVAQTRPTVTQPAGGPPSSAIYIGNSFFYFNNGINAHVSGLLAGLQPAKTLRSVMVTISGSGFDWHDVDSYFRPNAIGRYSFNPDNTIKFEKPERLFDVAVMMDCSQCPINPDLKDIFADYAKRDADIARKHGAEPVFFMSWAYQDKPEMTAQLAEAYTKAGNDNRALVVPAGLAFARSVAARPDIGLYIADKRHPTLAGSYLAAATMYASLFKASPIESSYTAGLDPDTARFLRTTAWETVQGYLAP